MIQYSTSSAQYQWLANDLNANASPCTLVYFHRPVYGASWTGGAPELAPWWNLFAQHGVKVVLSGHEHDYERTYPVRGYDAGAHGTVAAPNPGQTKGTSVDHREVRLRPRAGRP